MTKSSVKKGKWIKPPPFPHKPMFNWYVCTICGNESGNPTFCSKCLSKSIKKIEFVK